MSDVTPQDLNHVLTEAGSVIELLKWIVGVLLGTVATLSVVILRLWTVVDNRTEKFTRVMTIAVTTLKDMGVKVDQNN